MIADRLYTPGLAQVAYLVADEQAGVAAVIDPRRDVEVYQDWAATHSVRIVAALETHVHADFVSGARELAARTGATIYTSRAGQQDFPHQPLDDGDEVAVGALCLRAYATPGHTPEHLAYLLLDPARGKQPLALYSGDALFVGDVGRPDLLGAEATRGLAVRLYHTVERLRSLDDALVVYPGHTAGSSCGKKIGDAPSTTIGQERLVNYAFQARSEEEFVASVLAGMPAPPTYYPVLKRINKAGPALVASLPEGLPLPAVEVARRQAAGALVVDGRSARAFGDGHLPGAVAAGLGPDFTAWLGWIAPYDRDLLLVLGDEAGHEGSGAGQFDEARTELRRIGLDRVAGYLEGGLTAWRAAGQPVATLPQLTVRTLHQRLANGRNGLAVLDVRSAEEWESGHIAGAVHYFAGEIARGARPPILPAVEVALICGSGYRSSVAASLLQARGYHRLVNVSGGMEAWQAAGLPVIQS